MKEMSIYRNKTHGIHKLALTEKDGRVLCKVIFQRQLGYNSTACYGGCYWPSQQTMNAQFETLPWDAHVGVCLYGILFPIFIVFLSLSFFHCSLPDQITHP